MPAGILSPYSDGERDAVIAAFANHRRLQEGRQRRGSSFLPVPIRGEMPGRAMRGGTDAGNRRYDRADSKS
ncbi:hypothetical protein FJ977_21345 [Mesorhizobium sp. B2-1-3A]|nr:hypothetical protein FJ977_21345 [Mesorhizobium sp. B2-1-3A]